MNTYRSALCTMYTKLGSSNTKTVTEIGFAIKNALYPAHTWNTELLQLLKYARPLHDSWIILQSGINNHLWNLFDLQDVCLKLFYETWTDGVMIIDGGCSLTVMDQPSKQWDKAWASLRGFIHWWCKVRVCKVMNINFDFTLTVIESKWISLPSASDHISAHNYECLDSERNKLALLKSLLESTESLMNI